MNVSTVKKRFLPTMVKWYEYQYEKSNVVNDFGMLVFQNFGKDIFQMIRIFQCSNIPTSEYWNNKTDIDLYDVLSVQIQQYSKIQINIEINNKMSHNLNQCSNE